MKFLLITSIAILLILAIIPSVFSADKFVLDATEKIRTEMMIDGNYSEAIDKLNALLANYPKEPLIYLDLGIAHYGLMQYRDAYKCFKKSRVLGIERETKNLLRYAISQMEKNQITLVKIENAKNMALKNEIAIMHYSVLRELLKEKYYYPAIAITHIIWLKENMPASPGIYHLSGDIYYFAMYYKKAEEDYKKALAADAGNTRLNHALADCLVALGDFDGADEFYKRSIELYKKEGGKDTGALISKLRKIQRALPRRHKDIDELLEKEEYDRAEEVCKRRISLNQADYAAITQLGEIYWKKHERKKAIKLFMKAVKIAPDYPPSHFLLGRAYFFENNYQKGKEEFDTFKEKMDLLPKMGEETIDYYVAALHYISYLYATQKIYPEAVRECERIIELRPDDQRAHYNLAVCYYMNYRDRQKAYNELKKVIEIDPNSHMASRAEFYIDFIRRNPDPRIIEDFSFYYEKTEGID